MKPSFDSLTVRNPRLLTIIAVGLLTVGLGNNASLGSVVVSSFSLTDPPAVNDSATYGFAFDMATDFTVTKLGFWDFFGMNESHPVGLWDEFGNPKASATVTAASSLNSEFRYESIGPSLTLPAGRYVLGAFYGNGSQDVSAAGTSGLSLGSGVTFVEARNGGDDTGIAFPGTDISGIAGVGVFGPNMEFTAVPEPETYAAVSAAGMLGFAIWRRRNRGKAVAVLAADPR